MNAKIVNIALSIVLCAAVMQSCSSDESEEPVGNNSSVTINPDGSTSNGSQFSRVDDTTFYIDFIKYKIVDAHLEIVGYDKTGLSYDLRPYASVTYNGSTYQTREIADRAFNGSKIKSIILPNGLQGIGTEAFYGCTNLISVHLPEGLQEIGWSAFNSCTSLTDVHFPEGLQWIDWYAFKSCTRLTTIICNASIPPYIYGTTFSYETYQDAILYVPVKSIDEYRRSNDWSYFKSIQAISE
ncbi:MAG: leucine-rich repeat domain-containing protein [Muribaculaceae bacterium]|nr:leucine-rich repeat domain-containing protein [Muribaculaceae bacterium]